MDLPPFLDLHNLTENQRCKLIAQTCAQNPGKNVGFIVDNEEKKIVRYERKIKGFNPLVTIERVAPFTGAGFLLRASQPEHGKN